MLKYLPLLGATSVVATDAKLPALQPVVMWHGMGDNCCLPFSMGMVKRVIEEAAKNTGHSIYVHSVEVGPNPAVDEFEGFFGYVPSQLSAQCEKLKKIPELADGFTAIGFSQGGPLIRGLIQTCDGLKAKQLITFGGPHNGVMNIPGCLGPNASYCQMMAEMLAKGAYLPGVRDVSVQAQYFRSPLQKDAYEANNVFLADINNERPAMVGDSVEAVADRGRRQSHADKMVALDRFVMIKFTQDSVVVPKESAHFGSFPWGSIDRSELQRANETDAYRADLIGLQTMDKAGKLIFKDCPGEHMQFSMDYLRKEVLEPYVLPSGTKLAPIEGEFRMPIHGKTSSSEVEQTMYI